MSVSAFGNDITSANIELVFSAEEICPNGVVVQHFSADQMYTAEDEQVTETRMGVDGFMAAGFTPNIKVVTLSLEASSPLYETFKTLKQAQDKNRRPYNCQLVSRVPSIGQVFTWSEGVLHNTTWIPSAKRVLDPTQWTFHFQNSDVSTI